MNIHEYQAKELLAKYGVAVPKGIAALSVAEAVAAVNQLAGPLYVVKAQIHAGGRGAGKFKNNPEGKGGVRLCKSADEVKAAAEAMLGQILVTKQTGPEGKEVQRLYVTDGVDIKKEYYCSVVLDRATSRVTFMVSTEGGMDIEEVAEKHPEKIFKAAIDPATGMFPFYARKLAYGLGLEGDANKSAIKFFIALYKAFIELDCSIVEINPLIVTDKNEVLALDAKMNFDDNALFRQKAVTDMRDESEEDENEREAKNWELSYVRMDGNIGCMVNGAGLAMATMDIIKHYGMEPANFLDVGGGATTERVTAAFKIILSDPKV
ncbi:MAG: ADP-forming succinate--CoA ligase subunit beta, partial [Alphaproteobacteria bacterium]|nr:ADP-forming succinate--CoA ligase subunit beta [Alphaproteobacteria bacterium]